MITLAPAVRMPTHAVLLVQQPLPQRRIEPVLQRGPPFDEPVLVLYPVPARRVAGAVVLDPLLVGGPVGVHARRHHAFWCRGQVPRGTGRGHDRSRSAGSESASTSSSETRV